MVPFRLQYALGRRDRLAAELPEHLPALAAATGFVLGVGYLAAEVSAGFLVMLALPAVLTRRLTRFLFDLATVPAVPVELVVETDRLELTIGARRATLDLGGVVQLFRPEDRRNWTLLHLDGTVLTIPAAAIDAEQVAYLQGFALRAARARWRAEAEIPIE